MREKGKRWVLEDSSAYENVGGAGGRQSYRTLIARLYWDGTARCVLLEATTHVTELIQVCLQGKHNVALL